MFEIQAEMSFNKHEDVFELVGPVRYMEFMVETCSLHSFPADLEELIHDEVTEDLWAHLSHRWNPCMSQAGQTPWNTEPTCPGTSLNESS